MNAVKLHSMFAALPPESGLGPKVPGSGQDFLMVLVACAAIGLVILLAVTLWLRSRRAHRRHHHHRDRGSARPTTEPAEEVETADAVMETEHAHGRRRRRRAHRGRNPTLAETGGLPPPRPEGQVPPGL